MAILDFDSYKKTGKLEYISGSSSNHNAVSEEAKIQREQNELDSIAIVMEMSTDELIGELTVRNTTGHSIRTVETEHIVEELSQRLIAIEYILMVTMASYSKEDD
jgi:hypothetical protein